VSITRGVKNVTNDDLVPLYQSETAPKWIRGTVGKYKIHLKGCNAT
jgi:hypothetical protein